MSRGTTTVSMYRCECGIEIRIPEALEPHLQSRAHFYAPKIRKLIEDGATTYREIAHALGIAPIEASRIASQIDVKPVRGNYYVLGPEVSSLIAEGATTYREIAERLRINTTDAARIASRIGIRPIGKRPCECGLLLKNPSNAAHTKSMIHRYGARIRRLLEHDCITFAEIGRRLRLSRERVRQIATKLGVKTGRERRSICKLTTHHANLAELQAIAAQEALTFHLVPYTDSVHAFSSHRVDIGGLRCFVGSVSGRQGQVFSLRPPVREDYDFYLGKSLVGWLVIPKHQMPTKPTCFVLGRDKRRPGASGTRHDWNAFVDAWHLLKSCKEST